MICGAVRGCRGCRGWTGVPHPQVLHQHCCTLLPHEHLQPGLQEGTCPGNAALGGLCAPSLPCDGSGLQGHPWVMAQLCQPSTLHPHPWGTQCFHPAAQRGGGRHPELRGSHVLTQQCVTGGCHHPAWCSCIWSPPPTAQHPLHQCPYSCSSFSLPPPPSAQPPCPLCIPTSTSVPLPKSTAPHAALCWRAVGVHPALCLQSSCPLSPPHPVQSPTVFILVYLLGWKSCSAIILNK